MTAIIEARGLRKSYGSNLALDDVTFNVAAGRIVGMIGANGAGKTTTLKAILGLTSFQGDLTVLGRNPRTQRDDLMRDVCFIADVVGTAALAEGQPGAGLRGRRPSSLQPGAGRGIPAQDRFEDEESRARAVAGAW